MPDNEENGHGHGQPLDLVTAKAFSVFAQTTSRRGLLAAGGRLLLRVLGISLVPLLPFDRILAQGGPPNQDCKGDWQYCGQHGNFCQACCGGGPYVTGCPPCTNNGTWWTECCCCPGCNGSQGFNVNYVDCCGLKGSYTNAQAAACKGADCRNTMSIGWWCGKQGTYRCTVVTVTTPCSHCKQTH